MTELLIFSKQALLNMVWLTGALNAFYNVHQNTGVANVFNDVNIEWSTTDHNGHIKAIYYYQDAHWHCWNGIGDNVNCN